MNQKLYKGFCTNLLMFPDEGFPQQRWQRDINIYEPRFLLYWLKDQTAALLFIYLDRTLIQEQGNFLVFFKVILRNIFQLMVSKRWVIFLPKS